MSSQRPQTAALALELLQLNVEGLTIAKTDILELPQTKEQCGGASTAGDPC